MAENFPNLKRNLDIQVQEVHRSQNKLNVKRTSPRHIIMKLTKIKDKEKFLKAAKRKISSHTRELPKGYKQISQQKPFTPGE